MKQIIRISLLLALLAWGEATRAGETYSLPNQWSGTAEGQADGNPCLVAGQPRWRLDRVWPDDILTAANYVPMVWAAGTGGVQWRALEHAQGGQPRAKVEKGVLRTSGRAAWPDNKGQKLPALVFIAPTAGKYSIGGTVKTKFFQGDKPVTFHVLQHGKGAATLTPVKSYTIAASATEPVQLQELTANLKPGDELVFTMQFSNNNNAADFTISNLTIQTE